jgi:hypothetical protein
MSDNTRALPMTRAGASTALHGFGDGGSEGCHLFLVNQSASQVQVNDFTSNALSSIHDLLDEGVANGGMSGNRTWLVQQLLRAVQATSDSHP